MKKPLNIVITVLLLITSIVYGVVNGNIRWMILWISWGYSIFEPEIWIMRWGALAAILALVLFVIRVILTIREGAGKSAEQSANLEAEFGGRLGQLLGHQRGWVLEWCEDEKEKNAKGAYILGALILFLILLSGLRVEAPMPTLLTGYMAMGLFWAQVLGGFMWWLGYSRTKPEKIIQKQGKNLQKAAEGEGNPEAVYENLLEVGEEAQIRDQNKNEMLQVTMGSHYWLRLSTYGRAEIVEAAKVERIQTEINSYSTGRGMTRTVLNDYIARFYYQGSQPKKSGDRSFIFHEDSCRAAFLELVKNQLGDRVTIEAK